MQKYLSPHPDPLKQRGEGIAEKCFLIFESLSLIFHQLNGEERNLSAIYRAES